MQTKFAVVLDYVTALPNGAEKSWVGQVVDNELHAQAINEVLGFHVTNQSEGLLSMHPTL